MAVPILADITNLLRTGKEVTLNLLINAFSVVVNWLSDGTSDLNVNSITANTMNAANDSTKMSIIAGEDIIKERIVRNSGGLAFHADSAVQFSGGSIAGVEDIIGMSTEGASSGEFVRVEKSVFTPENPIAASTTFFVGFNGELNASPSTPNEARIRKKIGVSNSTGTAMNILTDFVIVPKYLTFIKVGPGTTTFFDGSADVIFVDGSIPGTSLFFAGPPAPTLTFDWTEQSGFTVKIVRTDNGGSPVLTDAIIGSPLILGLSHINAGDILEIMSDGTSLFLIGGNQPFVP